MCKALQAAKVQLTFEQPFFASLLLKRPPIETKDVPTMAVDRTGKICYNPDFIKTLSRDELMFVLCHEVMHIVCLHAFRRGSRDAKLWNVAADFYINSFLEASNVGRRPTGALFKDGSENKTTEQIYDELMQDDDSNGNNGKKQYKDSIGQDVMETGASTPEEQSEESLKVKLDIADAARTARERGKASGALQRMIEEVLVKKMKWYEILEKHFSGFFQEKISWDRPNRRYYSSGTYLPVHDHEPSMGTVVLGIDTSASISNEELQYFAGHINQIIEQCSPEKVYVVYCDTEVNHVDEFSKETYPVKLEPYGGGGTDMCEIPKWIEDNGIEADVCCILTDGYTDFPESAPCPLVWAITTEGITSPIGETVFIEED